MSDDWNQDEEEIEIIYVSKSELKRDMEDLKNLGQELIDMPLGKYKILDIDEELDEAIKLGRKLRDKKDAYRRHLQHTAKILNARDLTPLHTKLERIKQGSLLANAHYQQLEQLRDKLIAEGDSAINQAIQEHDILDRQKLRQLVRQAKKHTDQSKPNKSAKQIYEYLKESIPFEL